jgi:hypothetical protein
VYREVVRDSRHYFDLNAEDRGPALDESELRRLEEVLGVRLPEALVEMLRIRNGGWMRYSAFPMSRRARDGTRVASFYELMGVDSDGCGLFQIPYLRNEWGIPEWAVMLCGDGHAWIALDYRRGDDPAVVWLAPADEEDAPPEIIDLAPTFQTFLDGLQIDDDGICWGITEPTAIVLDRIRERHGVRLSERFDAIVLPAREESTGRVKLSSNRGGRDELVWPEFPAVRSLLRFDVAGDQRGETASWVQALGFEALLIHDGTAR